MNHFLHATPNQAKPNGLKKSEEKVLVLIKFRLVWNDEYDSFELSWMSVFFFFHILAFLDISARVYSTCKLLARNFFEHCNKNEVLANIFFLSIPKYRHVNISREHNHPILLSAVKKMHQSTYQSTYFFGQNIQDICWIIAVFIHILIWQCVSMCLES